MLSLVHSIRLAGPWEFQLSTGDQTWQTLKVPAAWETILLALAVPTACLTPGNSAIPNSSQRTNVIGLRARRRFQQPTGLTPRDRLWLVLPLTSLASIHWQINDCSPSPATFPLPHGTACDVTSALQASNLLQLEFELVLDRPEVLSTTFAGVVLEIRDSASPEQEPA